MLTIVAWFALSGCNGEEAAPPPVVPAVPAPAADDADGVRSGLLAGKYVDALSAAERGLGSHPADDVWWDLVEVAAIRAGQAGALLDRLQANEAIGGRVDRHFALRGSLAAEARRPVDLLAAAKALQDVAPGDAAVFSLAAVRLGASLPPDAAPATLAFVAAATTPGAARDPLVDGLTGDRAVLARVELLLAEGDRPGAAALLATVTPKDLLLAEAAAALKARVLSDATAALAEAEVGAKAATGAGDLVGAARIYGAVLPLAAGAFKADVVMDAAGKLRELAQEKTNTLAVAEAAALQAEAALRAGSPLVARDAAAIASMTAATKARGQWSMALAASMLGDASGVEGAATGLPGVRVNAVRDLARAMRGEAVTMPSPGISGADAAMEALLAAGWLREPAPALVGARAAAAAAPDLALWAQLWSTSAPIAAGEGATPALLAENAVRAYGQSGASGALGDLSHPNAAAWNAVITGTGEAPPGVGLGGWVRLRTSLKGGDLTQAGADLAQLAATSPEWRRGPWAPVLALDGVEASALDREVRPPTRGPDAGPLVAVMHGWKHREAYRDLQWARGISPVPGGLKPEVRDAVWAAAARFRVREVGWLAGAAEFPKDERKALEEAEAKAGLKARKPLTLKEIANAAEQNAVWSFLPTDDGVEVLAIAGTKSKFFLIPSSLRGDIEAFVGQLAAGNSAVPAGDRLRARVIDPAAETLLGIGTYHVVGPDLFGAFPIDALPEQSDGIRYLMSIRNVLHHGRFEDLVPADEPLEGSFATSMVSLGNEKEDLVEIAGLFPDGTALAGMEATGAAWKAAAVSARFLHFGKLSAAPDGGFRLPSGDSLYLGDIAGTPLLARVAVVGSSGDAPVDEARIAALHAAGVRDVLVTGWIKDEAFHTRLLVNFWDRANRRYNAVRSFAESRNEAIKEFPAAVSPAFWGGYQLSARK